MLCHKIYPAFFRGSSYLMELFYRSIIVTRYINFSQHAREVSQPLKSQKNHGVK